MWVDDDDGGNRRGVKERKKKEDRCEMCDNVNVNEDGYEFRRARASEGSTRRPSIKRNTAVDNLDCLRLYMYVHILWGIMLVR